MRPIVGRSTPQVVAIAAVARTASPATSGSATLRSMSSRLLNAVTGESTKVMAAPPIARSASSPIFEAESIGQLEGVDLALSGGSCSPLFVLLPQFFPGEEVRLICCRARTKKEKKGHAVYEIYCSNLLHEHPAF